MSRVLVGIGSMLVVQPSPMLITELAYPTHRGKYTRYVGLMVLITKANEQCLLDYVLSRGHCRLLDDLWHTKTSEQRLDLACSVNCPGWISYSPDCFLLVCARVSTVRSLPQSIMRKADQKVGSLQTANRSKQNSYSLGFTQTEISLIPWSSLKWLK